MSPFSLKAFEGRMRKENISQRKPQGPSHSAMHLLKRLHGPSHFPTSAHLPTSFSLQLTLKCPLDTVSQVSSCAQAPLLLKTSLGSVVTVSCLLCALGSRWFQTSPEHRYHRYPICWMLLSISRVPGTVLQIHGDIPEDKSQLRLRRNTHHSHTCEEIIRS